MKYICTMKSIGMVMARVILIAAPFLFLEASVEIQLDKEVIERLQKGKIVAKITGIPGSNTQKCLAMGVVYAPQKKVWEVISDYNHFSEFMPRIAESFIVSPEGINSLKKIKNGQIDDWRQFEKKLMKFKDEQLEGESLYFYNRFNIPWPLKDRCYILKMFRNPGNYYFHWILFFGNTKVNHGSWQLIKFKGSNRKTLAVYTLYIDPGISVSPSFMQIAMKIALPGTIKSVKKRVLSLILEERKNERAKSLDSF